MNRCKYYKIFKWGEPPLEPDENGTIETEHLCSSGNGERWCCCNGDLDLCPIEEHSFDCATNAAEVCDEFKAMGCTCKQSQKNRGSK